MTKASQDVVVVGAGVVGSACAYYLARRGARVTLLDSRPALSYTSSQSTECYRNYWAGEPAMTAFMNHSIDLLEQHAADGGNSFSINRRGYAFLSRTSAGAAKHAAAASMDAKRLGLGDRESIHADGGHGMIYCGATQAYDAKDDRVHAFQGQQACTSFFGSLPPFLSPSIASVLFSTRCGWMNAQQMGSYLLASARDAGASTIIPATLAAIRTDPCGAVQGVVARTSANAVHEIPCGAVVNAAGPFASEVSRLLLSGVEGGSTDSHHLLLPPLTNEIHAKAILRDTEGVVPPDAPMMIFDDEVALEWTDEEREALEAMGGFEATLTRPLPAGAHFRPYPGATNSLLLLWEALHMDVAVADPPPADPQLRDSTLVAELLLRGLSQMVPGLSERYLASDGTMQASVVVDGGYYTKAPDNRPIIGPLPGAPRGAYVCAGLSGYGVMAANAAGDLLAAHVTGEALPSAYAGDFIPERWCDAAYRDQVASGAAGAGLQI